MTGPRPRVLVIGATGVFGTRLARHLAAHGPGMDLLVASRSAERATALAAKIGATGVAVDTDTDLTAQLRALHPDIVVDCSGPFQGLDHRTARAAIAVGAHAVDLADARDYLLSYEAELDAPARQAGVAALAGASSTPALSGAVARHITDGWSRIDTLDIAITPGGRSEVGRSVLEAVTGYAGRPVPVWRDGRIQTVRGWGKGRTVTLPGLGPRRVAPVETVDAEHLGPTMAVRDRVTFCAGLESMPEQRGLELLAAVRARGWIGETNWLLPLLLKARRITRLTTGDTGGMRVAATGCDAEGTPARAVWSLLATDDDGPQVPTLAAAAAVRGILSGQIAPGARMADAALSLDAILAEAAPDRITTRLDGASDAPRA